MNLSATKVELSPNVLFRQVEDDGVMLDLDSERYLGFDAVAAAMMNALVEHASAELALLELLEKYDATRAEIEADLVALIERLDAEGLATITDLSAV